MSERNEWKLMLRNIVESRGFECVGVELCDGRSASVVRVYIDSAGGIGHEDCEAVSREITGYLDACEEKGEPCFAGKYFLEVSSPGVERPLFTAEHYARFIGKHVSIRTKAKKNVVGRLASCEKNGEILVETESGPVTLDLSGILRANLLYVEEKGEKKGGGGKKKKSKR